MAQTPIPHLTAIADITVQQMQRLFDAAEAMRNDPGSVRQQTGRIIATLLFEPSTRTRLSHEAAAHRLGARVIGFADASATSAVKGETLIDTIRNVQRYADLIVLRHPAEGAAKLASMVAAVPIVNAGDGGHEHPTQTLTDLYTIQQQLGSIEGRTIGLHGDLRYGRTAHSLAIAAAWFGAKLICISPDKLQMPAYVLEQAGAHTTIETTNDLARVIGALDVLYATRLQRERLGGSCSGAGDTEGGAVDRDKEIQYPTLTPETLRGARADLLLLHPLPRSGEIAQEIDEDPRAMYFEQAANGVVVRMALLEWLLEQSPRMPLGAARERLAVVDPPWQRDDALGTVMCSNARCVSRVEPGVMPRGVDGKVCAFCGFALEGA